MKQYIYVGLGLATLFSSCIAGKKYTRPELDLPETYREQQVKVTADSVALSWRTFFKDPVLVELIEKSLKKNNDIQTAMLNMQQLELVYTQARKGLLPTVDLAIDANRTWMSKNSLNGSLSEQFTSSSFMDDYAAVLRLSWEADIWGKAKAQKTEAQANFFAQKENLSALKTRIIVQVAQAYYNLMVLDEQLKVAEQNVEMSQTTLDMIRLQYNAAQVSSLAVGQAEAQKKTAELLIPQAKQSIAVQENALSILCGNYPEPIHRSGSLMKAMPEDTFPDGVPTALLSRRPDVKSAEYAVVAANSRVGLAKVAMYPSFSIMPSIGVNSFNFNNWWDLPGSLVKTVAANISQPVFQKKALKTNYEVALLEQNKAAIQFKQSVMLAVGEVTDELSTIKYTNERLALVAQKTVHLNKATDDAMLLYKNGMANYLEVITAQNNSLQNELEAVSIKRDQLNALTNLYRALGGGFED